MNIQIRSYMSRGYERRAADLAAQIDAKLELGSEGIPGLVRDRRSGGRRILTVLLDAAGAMSTSSSIA